MIVNRDHPEIEIQKEDFPPDDARAMSPRRNSEDLVRLGREAREALKMYLGALPLPISPPCTHSVARQARTLQSSLAALAERLDEVKSDHDKLESENRFLQDYIGGLTRTMSKSEISSSGSGKGKK
jgi:short coiled-coil protein